MFDDILEAAESYLEARNALKEAQKGCDYPSEYSWREADDAQRARDCFEKAFRAAVEHCLNPTSR